MTVVKNILVVLRKVCATTIGACGFVIVLLVLACALFAPWIATHNPDALDVMNRFANPSGAHWLGTDHLGRDLFSRMVHGASVAMLVALPSIAIALGLGTALGILAAYLPARSERFVLIVFDVISSFPSVVLALAIVAVFGPSLLIVVVIVAVTLVPHFGRVARSQVLTLRVRPFWKPSASWGLAGGVSWSAMSCPIFWGRWSFWLRWTFRWSSPLRPGCPFWGWACARRWPAGAR